MRAAMQFAGVFGVVASIYLVGLVVYRMYWLAQSISAALTFSPWSAGIALGIMVTMSIPFYLIFFEEQREVSEDRESLSDDHLVPPKTALKRVNEREVQLWILFVLLLTVLPLFILYHTHTQSLALRSQSLRDQQEHTAAAPVPSVVATDFASSTEAMNMSILPLYGGQEKDERMRAADASFVQRMIEMAGSAEKAYAATVHAGWDAYTNNDLDTAMQRFNQAWLISSSSPDSYRGMAFVEVRREQFDSAESLLEETRAHGGDAVMVDCDLGDLYRISAAAHGSSSDLIEKSYIAYRHAYMAGNVSESCAAMRIQMRAAVEQADAVPTNQASSSTLEE